MAEIDWEPLVRRLCPSLFDTENNCRLPSVRLVLMTLGHMDYDVSFGRYMEHVVSFTSWTQKKPKSLLDQSQQQPHNGLLAQHQMNFNNDCDSFSISPCGIAEMHLVRNYLHSMRFALPEYDDKNDVSRCSSCSDTLHHAPDANADVAESGDSSNVADDSAPPQLRTRTLVSRGPPVKVLVNALQPTPWSHMPFMTPLVEYLMVVSDAADCVRASKHDTAYFRNSAMYQFLCQQSAHNTTSTIQYVAHAWLAARVLSPTDDLRVPWSAYRMLGAVMKQLQHAPSRGLPGSVAESVFNRLQSKLLKLYANARYPNESDMSLMLRINWTASIRASLLEFAKTTVGLDVHRFLHALHCICRPVSWGTLQLQMEVQPQHAKLGWQWGVLIMALGCANVTPLNTINYTGATPHVPVQWGDALHGSDRQLAVLDALCDCPELLWQRSTIQSLLHWTWKRNWRTPCNTSPARTCTADVLRHLRPAMNAVLCTPTTSVVHIPRTFHIHAWSDFMCMFYGMYLVPVSDARQELCNALVQFRQHCDKLWTVAQIRGILPAPRLYESHNATDTQPLSLSIATHVGRGQWPRRSGRVGLWHMLYPHGTNGAFAQYAYHLTDNRDSQHAIDRVQHHHHHHHHHHRTHNLPRATTTDTRLSPETVAELELDYIASDSSHVDWSGGCSMAPLIQLHYPRASNICDFALQSLQHEHVMLTDLQQWLTLQYCARIMVRDVRMPFDVHHGPMNGDQWWTRVCGILRSGFQPELNVAVVPSRDLVLGAATEIFPWAATDVHSLQDTLTLHANNTWTVLNLVVLYAHWWTLDHWLRLMQTIDLTCTTQRQRSPSSSPEMARGALPRIAVRLHVFGTMWLSSMDRRVHHAIWPQLYHSRHANRFHFDSFASAPQHGPYSLNTLLSTSAQHLTTPESSYTSPTRNLMDLFYSSYATRGPLDQWIMPTTGSPFALHMQHVFMYMGWSLDASCVSAYMQPSADTTKTPELHDEESLVDTLLTLTPSKSANETTEECITAVVSEDELEIDDGEEPCAGDEPLGRGDHCAYGQLLPDSASNNDTQTSAAGAAMLDDTTHTLEPETLLLLSFLPFTNAIHLNTLMANYPRQEELNKARHSMHPESNPLRLRVWLRRPGAHVLLTHYMSASPEALRTMTPVCWCNTPYAHQLNCGELYMDPNLALHHTAAVQETQDTWKCPGTDSLYCSIMQYGKNGQYHYSDPQKVRRTLVWMQLADPMPLLDAMSLAHHERLIIAKRSVLSNQCWIARANTLVPTALDYTSMRARHVVLYVLEGTSMQSVWSAMLLASVSFSMVSIGTGGQQKLLLSQITHCRPLRLPTDGLWLEFAMDHALKKRAMLSTPVSLVASSASDQESTGNIDDSHRRHHPNSDDTLLLTDQVQKRKVSESNSLCVNDANVLGARRFVS